MPGNANDKGKGANNGASSNKGASKPAKAALIPNKHVAKPGGAAGKLDKSPRAPQPVKKEKAFGGAKDLKKKESVKETKGAKGAKGKGDANTGNVPATTAGTSNTASTVSAPDAANKPSSSNGAPPDTTPTSPQPGKH